MTTARVGQSENLKKNNLKLLLEVFAETGEHPPPSRPTTVPSPVQYSIPYAKEQARQEEKKERSRS